MEHRGKSHSNQSTYTGFAVAISMIFAVLARLIRVIGQADSAQNDEATDEEIIMADGGHSARDSEHLVDVAIRNGTGSELDERRKILNAVTQETRFVILQTIIGHPEQMPTLEELSYHNPSISKSTVRDHLDTLMEHNIVQKVKLPKGERKRDLPHSFYALTEQGRAFLGAHGLLSAEEALQDLHDQTEKTEKIRRYENADRPNLEGDDEASLTVA